MYSKYFIDLVIQIIAVIEHKDNKKGLNKLFNKYQIYFFNFLIQFTQLLIELYNYFNINQQKFFK